MTHRKQQVYLAWVLNHARRNVNLLLLVRNERKKFEKKNYQYN